VQHFLQLLFLNFCVDEKAHATSKRMLKAGAQSRLYCYHYVPSNIDCSECRQVEVDYNNRPLYAPLYVPLPNLPTVLDNSQLQLPTTFYVPLAEKADGQKRSDGSSKVSMRDDCIEIDTNKGTVRVPRSTLIYRSRLNASRVNASSFPMGVPICDSPDSFSGDFQKHAHRFTRSFSWKTKPEEPPFAHMQPLPKLIKRPGYVEICCKSRMIDW
jgi:hypothetical protein